MGRPRAPADRGAALKIAAALCWYDEPPEFLERCVTSLHALDLLVALDGKWQLMDGPDTSPAAQHKALEHAAAAVDLELITEGATERGHVYTSQTDKRTDLLTRCVDAGADWILIVDGDEYVHLLDDRVRRELERTKHDCATVGVQDTNDRLGGYRRTPRRLIRATPGLHYAGAHNALRTIDGRLLVAPVPQEDLADEAVELDHLLELHHDIHMRSRGRITRQMDYYRRRARFKIERPIPVRRPDQTIIREPDEAAA